MNPAADVGQPPGSKPPSNRLALDSIRGPRPVSIPDHELLSPIASGAYGEVWLARNAVGTLRAVKVVRRDAHASAESFEREFKGLQKFEPVSRTHDGLVDILTLGLLPEGAGFYYVMELADDSNEECGTRSAGLTLTRPSDTLSHRMGEGRGEGKPIPQSGIRPLHSYAPRTLRAELKSRGALPADEVIALGLKLTAALAHLHAQGLVHRDVKPSNILFIGGEPKLADAGLVAAVDDARSLVGTAGYIAPEGPGTPQADLYALGKVLYEAAFGKDRQEFPALPADVASRPDHARLLELNAILLKACATDGRERYQLAVEMRAEIEGISGPMAAGLGRPMILLPEHLLRQLSLDEFEQICLHELAHLRRRDDWTHLVQQAIAALFFFHPAVRWIARRLDLEREVACDDWVGAATGGAKPYAACLTRLFEFAGSSGRGLLAPGAWLSRSQLTERIETMLDRNHNRSVRPSRTACVSSALGISVLLACGVSYSPFVVIAQNANEAPRAIEAEAEASPAEPDVAEYRRALEQAERAVQEFGKKHGIVEVDRNDAVVKSAQNQFRQDSEKTKKRAEETRKAVQEIDELLRNGVPVYAIPLVARDSLIQSLSRELALAEAEFEAIKVRYKSGQVEYAAAEAKAKSLSAARKQRAETLIQAARFQAGTTEREAEKSERLMTAQQRQAELLDRLREEYEQQKREAAEKVQLYKAVLAKISKTQQADREAAQNSVDFRRRDFVVSISAIGRLKFQNQPVAENELKKALQAAFAGKAGAKVLTIAPDPSAPMGALIRVVDLAKEVGFSTQIATQPARPSASTPPQPSSVGAPNNPPLEAVPPLREDLLRIFIQNKEFREHRSLSTELTPEGLVISFLDRPTHPLFKPDMAEFSEYGRWVFDMVAWEIARFPSVQIEVEGHTEKGFKPIREGYDSWALSSDLAHIARRQLLKDGVMESQITKVTGFGDIKPLKDRRPEDSVNRRVSLLLREAERPPRKPAKTVTVLGEVQGETGAIAMPDQGLDILEAIAQAGGFTPHANKNQIRLFRQGKRTDYKLDELLKISDPSKKVWLEPGDVIYVPERFFRDGFPKE